MKRVLTDKERLAFALDVPSADADAKIIEMAGLVGWVKANSVFVGGGKEIIVGINKAGSKAFLDLKWHDIPGTVKNYGREVRAQLEGVQMINVHSIGGFAMMKGLVDLLDEIFADEPEKRPLVIAVTVLTSHDEESYQQVGFRGTIAEGVKRLAKLAYDAGCDGVVASPEEAHMIKTEISPDFLVVTPGIRFEEEFGTAAQDDQKRIATPYNASRSGSDILVMGRSLLRGGPAAVERAYKDIARARKERFGDPLAEGCTGSYS